MIKTERPFDLKVHGAVEDLVPYPPGKPIEELERELGITGSIKLASNENPLGPSPKAVEAVKRAVSGVNRYPDGSCHYLRERLSAELGVSGDMLVFGNGSNEIIELMVRTFMAEGDEAVMADPSFAVYPILLKTVGGVSVRVPLKDFTHDLDAMSEAVGPRTRIVFIANPNNPTGTIVTREQVQGFMDKIPPDVIVCMDEAYFEFVRSPEYPDTLAMVKEGKRPVVVLRTFSKVFGLAGLRIGYGVAHPQITDYLNRVRQPFNVNAMAQAAALACLEDPEHLERTRENNSNGLDYLYSEVDHMGLEYVPTEANFFLIKVGDGGGVYEKLLRKGVIVRPMKSYGLGEYIRVTVGLPEENERFVRSLQEVLGAGS